MKATLETAGRPEHLWLFVLAAGAVIGSLAVQTTPDGALRLPMPFISEKPCLPEVCMSSRVLGVSCPGCGLTRSFVAVAHGRWIHAFHCNPMGPILFVICVLQLPYRFMEYYGIGRSVEWWMAVKGRLDLVTWFVVVGLVGQWLVRMIAGRLGSG